MTREEREERDEKVYKALWEGNVTVNDLSKEHIDNPQCEVNLFDGDKINTASKTLSPNDIRKVFDDADEQQRIKMFGQKAKADEMEEVIGYLKDEMKRQMVEGVDISAESDSQEAKADAGKAEIRLVPMEIIWAIAWIRMYGNRKYGDPENWKLVEPERYRDAMMRHLLHYISDPKSVDEESGYPHLWHAACNMAFLMHFDYGDMTHYDYAKKAAAEGAYEGGKHEQN